MSYAGKIMSDVVFSTSDPFFAIYTILITRKIQEYLIFFKLLFFKNLQKKAKSLIFA